jgi:hypothetical protein
MYEDLVNLKLGAYKWDNGSNGYIFCDGCFVIFERHCVNAPVFDSLPIAVGTSPYHLLFACGGKRVKNLILSYI